MNKFVSRPDGNKQVVTLLTGKYTFDEAKALAAAINAGSAAVPHPSGGGAAGVFIPVGSGVQIIPPVNPPPIR